MTMPELTVVAAWGGPPLHPGRVVNCYTGRAGQGLLRVLARTAPQVRRIRPGPAAPRQGTEHARAGDRRCAERLLRGRLAGRGRRGRGGPGHQRPAGPPGP